MIIVIAFLDMSIAASFLKLEFLHFEFILDANDKACSTASLFVAERLNFVSFQDLVIHSKMYLRPIFKSSSFWVKFKFNTFNYSFVPTFFEFK